MDAWRTILFLEEDMLESLRRQAAALGGWSEEAMEQYLPLIVGNPWCSLVDALDEIARLGRQAGG